jgi:hypothetical protein
LLDRKLIEFITSGTDTYSLQKSPAVLVPPMAVKPRKGFEDTLFITENPLAAILGVTLGIPSVSVTEDGWLDPSVTSPCRMTRSTAPRPQNLRPGCSTLAEGREVIFDSSFGLSPQLGHSLKYHYGMQSLRVASVAGRCPDARAADLSR